MKRNIIFAIVALFVICFCISSCVETDCTHSFVQSGEPKEATCLESGLEYLRCSQCGYVKEEIIAKADHDMQISSIVASTCTESGYTEYACSVCGVAEKGDFTPAMNHNYQVSSAVSPTCTDQGYTLMLCSNCGDSMQTNQIKETGHSYILVSTVASTCSAEGRNTYKCSQCNGMREDIMAKVDHQAVTDPAVSATCTENGLTEGKHCAVCSAVITPQNVVDPKGHTEVVDKAVDSTCTATGLTEGRHCSVCNVVTLAQQMLPVSNHDYSSANGNCRVCGASNCAQYHSYEDFYSVCNVSDDGKTVRFFYDNPQSIVLHLQKFVFPSGKQYVFVFGSNAGGCEVSSNGTLYSNITFEIQKRLNEYELTFNNASFENVNSVINSDAYCLLLTFCGDGELVLQTTKAENGANGKSYGPLQIGNGENGGRGADAAPAIFCNGMLKIECAVPVSIRGGDGGDGGNGGDSDSSGSSGGIGGNGGNGAMAIQANDVEVSFEGEIQRSDFQISGGNGGSQGTGGTGRGFLWIGTTKASDGQPGSSAIVCNVNIRYN